MNQKMNITSYRLEPSVLRWRCDPGIFDFECTEAVEPLERFIGQDRALNAIDFGLHIDRPGYNLFVTGYSGSGRATAVKQSIENLIRDKLEAQETFDIADWCYVFNFSNPDSPGSLRLKAGQGKTLAKDVDELRKNLRDIVPKTFASEEYKSQKQIFIDEHQRKHRSIIHDLEKQANEEGFAFRMTSMGPILVPLSEGKPMTQEQYIALSDDEKTEIENKRQSLLSRINTAFEKIHQMEADLKKKVSELDRKVGSFAVTPLFKDILKKYEDCTEVIEFLHSLQDFTLSFLPFFREPEEGQQQQSQPPQMAPYQRIQDPFIPFKINVFVDNAERDRPPVILESHPNWTNLFGRIERRAFMGTYFSDHTMLKAGSFHQGNGGYLILYFRDLIVNPGVWDGLKRVLKTGKIKMEDPWEQYGLIAPQGMKPDPLPFRGKIILIGDEYIYRLLSFLDEDFHDLFKVKADFDYRVHRNDRVSEVFACFVKSCCDSEKLLPFHKSGVARSLEYASRMVSHQEKMTSRLGHVKDLLVEADYWARKEGEEYVFDRHVSQAVQERRHRLGLIEDRLQENIAEDILLIDTEGAVAGQVNGLAVYELGDFSFGRPSRITARTFLGRQGLVNIERESKLSGRIHDKGVLIMGGYLGSRYAQERPLSLAGSICFEQSYEGVEGDSASLAETCALLSSLADQPLRQDMAVTGSINQKGEVQAIGGVNQKVEGFFKTCRARGLTQQQGVIIPAANVRNLMLDNEVTEAVERGDFHLYTVSTVDQAMEILTGFPAGERKEDGLFEEGTLNRRVESTLMRNVEILRRLGEKNEEAKNSTEPSEEK